MQHLVSGYHNYDIKTPPASLTAVQPSCQIRKPANTDGVHVIIARENDSGQQLSEVSQPKPGLFSKTDLETAATEKAERRIKTQKTSGVGYARLEMPNRMSISDIVITESRKPVFVVVAGRYRTHYNFSVAPYAKVSGVLVFTESEVASVSGLAADVPVYFQSEAVPATKRCWTRIENKPDETWKDHKKAMRLTDPISKQSSRYHLLTPIYRKFASKVRSMAGNFSDQELINVGSAKYFLIGPAPTQIEQRIPYSPLAGSHIRYMQSDYVQFGQKKELDTYFHNLVEARVNELMGK